MKDFFEPAGEPARTIYLAWAKETEKRNSRTVEEWIEAERKVILEAVNCWADFKGMRKLTSKEVIEAESYALGHVDFGSKFVYKVLDKLMEKN